MKLKKLITITFLIVLATHSIAQNDSINKKLLYGNLAFDALAISSSYVLLNSLWYKDYPQTTLHWFNDCNEWNGMDKVGHSFSTYHISSVYTAQMKWSGLDSETSAIIGSSLGFITMSSIELLDAQSSQWGASACDLLANFIGASLYLGQQIGWKEQRLILKYSFHSTELSDHRPDLLGETFGQQLIKDYNGQTYWLSANIRSFTNIIWWPKIINIAIGYGANGMLGGKTNPEDLPYYDRYSQFYLSIDLDLRAIPTKSKFLKSIFSVINIIKFPMPTLEYSNNQFKGHYLYF